MVMTEFNSSYNQVREYVEVSTTLFREQRLVLETLPRSRLSEVGDRPLEDLLQFCTKDQNDIEPAQGLLQYCTEDQNAIELAQGTITDCPPKDPDQLSSPI